MDSSDNFSSFEIKLEIDELIIKNEPENLSREHKFDMNLPTNTEMKMDPLMCSNFPKDATTSQIDDSFHSKLQIKVEQQEEDDAYLAQGCSISDADQVTLTCEINKEIKLELEEVIIKGEPEELEELGSPEIIKYNTNLPTLGIHVITSEMDRYINFNLQDNDLGENNFECKVCSLYIPLSLFKQHMLIHEKKRPFKCQQCAKGFIRNGHLKRHMLIHANKKLYKCQQCGKKFSLKCNLKVHMLSHENKRSFKCPQCDKDFNRNSNLKAHVVIHENKKPFSCEECNKKFTVKQSLKRHMLIHENKKPFKCQKCGKGFSRNVTLNRHVPIHENKRPFKCQQCGKRFSRNIRLKRHMSIHENKRPFKCQQ